MYFSCGDISDYFYHIESPPHVRNLLSLPHIQGRFLDEELRLRLGVGPGETLTPCLTVIPMGWSWALWIAQAVHEEKARLAGLTVEGRIRDRVPTPPLSTRDTIHALYVDNYMVCGHDPNTVQHDATKHGRLLEESGLPIHEVEEIALHTQFAGLTLDGESCVAKVSPQRIWRLKYAIDFILSAQCLHGSALQAIVGHITWCMMVNRSGLSILNHTYDFCRIHQYERAPLWNSVRAELALVRAILPLLTCSLDAPWDHTLTATDASLTGYGVTERKLDSTTIGKWGRVSERWRYDCEDAVSARAHALNRVLEKKEAEDIAKALMNNTPFCEIPGSELLGADGWKTIISGRFRHEQNIMRLEGRALEMAIRRRFRGTQAMGKRLLFLIDNLSLCLALCKGRSSSPHLIQTCRLVCAHSLATGVLIRTRWIASESNPADEPSRRFEIKRTPHHFGVEQASKRAIRPPPGLDGAQARGSAAGGCADSAEATCGSTSGCLGASSSSSGPLGSGTRFAQAPVHSPGKERCINPDSSSRSTSR